MNEQNNLMDFEYLIISYENHQCSESEEIRCEVCESYDYIMRHINEEDSIEPEAMDSALG